MTREENLHWLNQEIRTWENECQSKHPIKEALYAARKTLKEQKKGHWADDGHGHIVCTYCNSANVTIWKSNFCPSCGADMREDE